jgi:glycine/D-amino acid oxidase-like deaminating enzyme
MSEKITADLVTRTWSRPFERPESIPGSADIVIIGGGIVGVSTAWFLARRGVKVALCEKGHIAGEQSGRNWGWVRQNGRDAREMPMIMESLNIWRTLAEDIGEDVGFTQTGCLYAARTDDELEGYAAWLPTAREYGLDTCIISGDEIAQLVPGATTKWKGGTYTASDGQAEPHKAAPAIARAAARSGASILTSCAVRGIETSGGRVSAVVTEHGTIKTRVVCCAAGAWTSMFCRSLDVSLPQLTLNGTVVRTAPGEKVLNTCVWDEDAGIRRRQDGGYNVAHSAFLEHPIVPSTFRFAFRYLPAFRREFGGVRLSIGREFIEEWRTPKRWRLDAPSPFEKTRVLDPKPHPRAIAGIRKIIAERFPPLAGIDIVEAWSGAVETTPDAVPVIDEVEAPPGFYIATGLSGHGFGIGPGAGKAIAGMLTGTETGIDLSEFRLSRFFDGSPIRLQE